MMRLVCLKQGTGRVTNGNKSAGSALMPYPLLFNAMSSRVTQEEMDLITADYQQLRVYSSETILSPCPFILPICQDVIVGICVCDLAGEEDF